MQLIKGRIVKSLSGFYDVEAAEGVFTCKGKGSFRNKKIVPMAGDIVQAEIDGDNVGTVCGIEKRTSELRRPPVANGDVLLIIASADEPKPNLNLIDRMSAIAVHARLQPVVIFTKCDLADCEQYVSVYRKAGIPCYACSAKTGEGMESFADLFATEKLYILTGNSGVGKSSLLNAVAPQLQLETNTISYKLGRGKHTTRCVSLYKIGAGYVADTPGFSSLEDADKYDVIIKEDLADCFPEFADYSSECRFTGCSHVCEKGCAVLEAVKDGRIPQSRHNSYCIMYEEVRNIKKWEKKQP